MRVSGRVGGSGPVVQARAELIRRLLRRGWSKGRERAFGDDASPQPPRESFIVNRTTLLLMGLMALAWNALLLWTFAWFAGLL
jgi:hypothetical protein